jgi:GntP family gluconate:H+ symporter
VQVSPGAIAGQLSGRDALNADPPLPGGTQATRRGRREEVHSSQVKDQGLVTLAPAVLELKARPAFGITVFTILLPVVLMMAASAADLALDKQSAARAWIDFIGQPTVAMLLAVVCSFYTFGIAIGFGKEEILKFTNECLGPVAMVLLVVGAGGGFSKTLEYSGVGHAITGMVIGHQLSPILLGWIIACLLRIAAGSATVAITTAAGIMAPIAAGVPGTNLELLVIAMGAGSGIFSHLNDGGFWFVKEYFNMTVPQTLKTWSVLTTIKSLVALLLVVVLNALLK